MKEMNIQRDAITIDPNGRVVIKNDELKRRVEEFLKDPKNISTHSADSNLFDNCDCKCEPK